MECTASVYMYIGNNSYSRLHVFSDTLPNDWPFLQVIVLNPSTNTWRLGTITAIKNKQICTVKYDGADAGDAPDDVEDEFIRAVPLKIVVDDGFALDQYSLSAKLLTDNGCDNDADGIKKAIVQQRSEEQRKHNGATDSATPMNAEELKQDKQDKFFFSSLAIEGRDRQFLQCICQPEWVQDMLGEGSDSDITDMWDIAEDRAKIQDMARLLGLDLKADFEQLPNDFFNDDVQDPDRTASNPQYNVRKLVLLRDRDIERHTLRLFPCQPYGKGDKVEAMIGHQWAEARVVDVYERHYIVKVGQRQFKVTQEQVRSLAPSKIRRDCSTLMALMEEYNAKTEMMSARVQLVKSWRCCVQTLLRKGTSFMDMK